MSSLEDDIKKELAWRRGERIAKGQHNPYGIDLSDTKGGIIFLKTFLIIMLVGTIGGSVALFFIGRIALGIVALFFIPLWIWILKQVW